MPFLAMSTRKETSMMPRDLSVAPTPGRDFIFPYAYVRYSQNRSMMRIDMESRPSDLMAGMIIVLIIASIAGTIGCPNTDKPRTKGAGLSAIIWI
jgi:hypothetical protein